MMYTLNCNGRPYLIDRPIIMSVLNYTDDSFYSGSRMSDDKKLFSTAEMMLAQGTDILDIGAQSTRPGSIRLSAEDEIKKLKKIVPYLRKMTDKLISIDTYHSEVARRMVEYGADIINDISAGTMDDKMIATVGKLGVPYVCMHIKGTPDDMQKRTHYEDILKEIIDFLSKKLESCRQAGIKDVIIDPGLGFAKTPIQNIYLIKNLDSFKILDCPVLIGISRKSTVYKTLQITPEESLNGTTVLNTLALLNGADILRVHDVKEAKEAVKLMDLYHNAEHAVQAFDTSGHVAKK